MASVKAWCLWAGLAVPALLAAAGEEYEFLGLSAGGSIFMGNCSPHDPKDADRGHGHERRVHHV